MIMLIYSVGFSITLWKEKNKVGSIAVFILALLIAIIPLFTNISIE
ncbi:hypothetical protein U5N28_05440 [Lysinibacillus telephonicus]|nr:hypothetical protein [Lysinibacillus telephonicus]